MKPAEIAYTVRTATDVDLLAIVRLHHTHETAAAIPPPDTPSQLQRRTWERMMATDNLTVYVAEGGDGIVGNTCVTIVPNLIDNCRPTAFIEPVLVAAHHRRRRVGRLMIEQALEDAHNAGCYKVQLLSHTRHAHDGAHAFYRSLGFVPEAEGFRLHLDDNEQTK